VASKLGKSVRWDESPNKEVVASDEPMTIGPIIVEFLRKTTNILGLDVHEPKPLG